MSEETKPENGKKPEGDATTAVAEKPDKEEEKPVNTDVFQSCTSRVTRKAWNIFLEYNAGDKSRFRTEPVRATLECHSENGAEELTKQLQEAGVSEISRDGKVISMTATLEQIQIVIKLPEAKMLDAVRI